MTERVKEGRAGGLDGLTLAVREAHTEDKGVKGDWLECDPATLQGAGQGRKGG